MSDHADVVAALAELALGSTGVAGTLILRGCTGVRDEEAACPVAVYVWRRTGVDVRVQHLSWSFDPPRDTGSPGDFLPVSVAEFVAAFDRGEHPELDRTQPEEP